MAETDRKGGSSAMKGLSIPQVAESELTPLERGLIGQVAKLLHSVECWKDSQSREMAQLRSENAALHECLQAYEQRISDLQNDIARFEQYLSRL